MSDFSKKFASRVALEAGDRATAEHLATRGYRVTPEEDWHPRTEDRFGTDLSAAGR